MEYSEKYAKLKNHVQNNPKDYQSVIALYKMHSDQIAHERKAAQNQRLKLIAKYRRELDEE